MRAAVAAALIATSALFIPWLIQVVAAIGLFSALAIATKRLLDRYPRRYLYWGLYLAALIVAFPATVLLTLVIGTAVMLCLMLGVTFGDSRWVQQNMPL